MSDKIYENELYMCSQCIFCEGNSCAWNHEFFNFDADYVDCDDFEDIEWDLIFKGVNLPPEVGQADEDDGYID